MKKILYYTVYYHTYEGADQNGIRDITVYSIENNVPKTLAEFEAFNDFFGETKFSDEEEIQMYLDNNGYKYEEFEMVEL